MENEDFSDLPEDHIQYVYDYMSEKDRERNDYDIEGTVATWDRTGANYSLIQDSGGHLHFELTEYECPEPITFHIVVPHSRTDFFTLMRILDK